MSLSPQRALRGHRPARLSERAAVSGAYVARLSERLTERDRWIARMLHEHRVLTTAQLAEIAFTSARAANQRLLQLHKWRLVDRFQPFLTYGSAPMHYVLDVAGAAVLAYEDGLDPRDLNYRHDRALGIAHSLHLAHTVGTNAFFTHLIAASRRPDATGRLTAWWSEARCRRHFGDIVIPDGYGRWQEGDTVLEWFLEYDLATERPDRVAAKLPRYHRLAATTGITTPILVHLPTTRREARVRHALVSALATLTDSALVPVATTSADHTDARWQPLDRLSHRRLPLHDLPTVWPHLTPPNPTQPAVPDDDSPTDLLPPPPLVPEPTPRRPHR
ncbi:replication-relaxation family protein [Streptomyces roseirectus]|uniref:Replication-relaxation family protein n=1 Tax=Streptomyces roseirectus TaxID=2768066 RepID=A0A7H0IQD9_9ACTN|nr:replication-relaxation family protein [Streptomyces roseirectus]QNP75005.1 replication-relaxation family protein [Streptomyces roseirectus]